MGARATARAPETDEVSRSARKEQQQRSLRRHKPMIAMTKSRLEK